MDKKYKKPLIENRLKDRGDDTRKYLTEKSRRKPIDGIIYGRTNTRLNYHEQGDSDRKTKAGDKIKQEKRIMYQTRKYERTGTKPVLNKKEIYKPKSPEIFFHSNTDEIRINDLEKRRLLREKYTFRRYSNVSPNFIETDESCTQNAENPDYAFVERYAKKQSNNSYYQATGTSNDSGISECTKTDKETNKRDNIQRKPIIKTISSNNDTAKIYKAVTFVDENKNPPKPLKINLVNVVKRSSRIPRLVKDKISDSKIENRQYDHAVTIRKKKMKRLVRYSSPESAKRTSSPPPTEVARWAPASVNTHTKPYYDAWVSKTLAAISRNSKKDKLYLQKENLLRSFQRIIDERPSSPELTYDCLKDERYAGRIKVRQRQINAI